MRPRRPPYDPPIAPRRAGERIMRDAYAERGTGTSAKHRVSGTIRLYRERLTAMHVLEIGYPFIPVPPNTGYGPTEAVISCVTEEMVARGHRVTLWAPDGSHTAA